ncbi:MAG: hypothetical protein R2689_05855 [Microthrixaceae bacterium]|nr:hypothetical protein [Microthrixaceae bacterium]
MTSPSIVTVRCQGCGSTLGTLRSIETEHGWEGDWPGARTTHGAMLTGAGPACLDGRTDVRGADDWNTITCLHCQRAWHGRDAYLHDLPAAADGGEARLGQPTPTATTT